MANHPCQALRDRMLARMSIEDAFDRFVPPSQTDLTERPLSDSFTKSRKFEIECEECNEVGASFPRCKKRAEITVIVVTTHVRTQRRIIYSRTHDESKVAIHIASMYDDCG